VLSQGNMAFYELKKEFGAAWRTPAGIVHTMSNKSDKPYRNVTFEIKRGHASVADGQALMLRPGESASREWEKNDHLLIAMSDLEVSDVAGEKQNTIRLMAGDAAWIPRGAAHHFTNIGTKGALATTFEFE
jgi:mannose-6-phosphate isomerase-like protein (cupin superfamily)